MGDAACSNVSLSFGMPADRIHIRASLALSEKCCLQHGGSIIAVHQRTTACCHQIFMVGKGEDGRNSSQNALSVC